MTPEEIARDIQGLVLHSTGPGGRVLQAHADSQGQRLILEIEDGGRRHRWEVAVSRLAQRAGGTTDPARIRAAVTLLYAEETRPNVPYGGSSAVETIYRETRPTTIYEGSKPGSSEQTYDYPGSGSPGPGDPDLDL